MKLTQIENKVFIENGHHLLHIYSSPSPKEAIGYIKSLRDFRFQYVRVVGMNLGYMLRSGKIVHNLRIIKEGINYVAYNDKNVEILSSKYINTMLEVLDNHLKFIDNKLTLTANKKVSSVRCSYFDLELYRSFNSDLGYKEEGVTYRLMIVTESIALPSESLSDIFEVLERIKTLQIGIQLIPSNDSARLYAIANGKYLDEFTIIKTSDDLYNIYNSAKCQANVMEPDIVNFISDHSLLQSL